MELAELFKAALLAPFHFLWIGMQVCGGTFAVYLCWNFYRTESRRLRAKR
ncbi:MAG: hypothetical protein ACRDQZ_11810 [Mycobacteriales bacterium]